MLLYLIRHGEPDYAADALTERGWEQARRVAERLAESGIDEIYASPMGRARQTAQPTAEKLGLPVLVEPWAYELAEEGATCFPDGVSKRISSLPPEYFQQPEFRRFDSGGALERIPALRNGGLAARCRMLTDGFDGMLARLGYRRNASGSYDVIRSNDRRAAFFCHVAMMRVLLAHAMNLPLHLLLAGWVGHFTGVTILGFHGSRPSTSPVMLSYADIGHLYGKGGGPQMHYSLRVPF